MPGHPPCSETPRHWVIGVAVAAALVATPALAQPARPDRLQGEVFLGGATLVDPPPGEARDSHAYFTVTGAAARRLYDAMGGTAERNLCEPRLRSRRQGSLTCSIGPQAADTSCSFGVDLRRGGLAAGPPC